MKDDTRKRLARLILEELAEKIKESKSLSNKLEAFSDLPVEKVADAILKQFEYLLSSDLRDLIIHLIEQDVASGEKETPVPMEPIDEQPEEIVQKQDPIHEEDTAVREPEEKISADSTPSQSIMEHFGVKELFPSQPMDIPLLPDDWFYLYGYSYAPDSAGKGIPTIKLDLKGIDKTNNIFVLDYGDVRLYLNKVSANDFTRNRGGEPTVTSKAAIPFKFMHEQILNVLRTQEVLVPLPFWTIFQGRENIIKLIEDRYVELLRLLIDLHDSAEWDVEVFAFDDHIARMPEMTSPKGRIQQRDTRRPVGVKTDVKVLEKVILQEKNLAQQIHSLLILKSTKTKIDFMIRLDSAFLDDWKSIFSARYTVGKEKRKMFFQTIAQLQDDFRVYELMIHVSSPNVRISIQK